MASSINDNSQTAVIGTEHTLDTITTAGTYVLLVDTNAMVLIDELELRVKTKVRSVGTTRQAYIATYKHNQGSPVKISIPVTSINEILFTLKQISGTGRAFPWEIVRLDA